MSKRAFAHVLRREDLPEQLGSDITRLQRATDLDTLASLDLAPKEIAVGHWGEGTGDPFPDFIIIRDEDYDDTLAWMSAYLTGLTPISQWCRCWRASEVAQLQRVSAAPKLGRRLGPWVGTIIAEYSSQASQSLKEVSGAAALTTASYSAARAIAVWGGFDRFDELLKRHEALFPKSREISHAVSAEHLLPLWYVLAGDRWEAKRSVESRSLDLFVDLVEQVTRSPNFGQDRIVSLAQSIGREMGLIEIAHCAVGPQGQRVEALDSLASRLLLGPKTPATSAIMGFGASLVDPGAPVLPELLRRYADTLPAAVHWAGAFAGVWSPLRVLSEHAGLGRLIAKEIQSDSDLLVKPSADISFEELSRWTGGGFKGRVALRGLMLRTLFVEMIPGVVVPIPALRGETPQADASSTKTAGRQQAFELATSTTEAGSAKKNSKGSVEPSPPADLVSRIERLEKIVRDLTRVGTRAGGRQATTRSGKTPT